MRYGVVGLFTNGTIYLIFLGLIWSGLHPVLASGLCYGMGVIFSYILNRRWTFNSQSHHKHDAPRFVLAYALGLIITLVSMTALIKFVAPELAQLATALITAIAIYSCLRIFRFGESALPKEDLR
ncbi:MAG: GtrA family protein [Kordiimonas sp.]